MALRIVEYPVQDSKGPGRDWHLMKFLSQQGVLNERYLAFSLPLSGSGNVSDLEECLSNMGEVRCDVLGTGDLNHSEGCKSGSFFDGKAAIGIYDTEKMVRASKWTVERPKGASPSEYVAMVIVPKVKEASVA